MDCQCGKDEIWRAIPDYKGYEASNRGRIRAWVWRGKPVTPPKVKKLTCAGAGYLYTYIGSKNFSVHRLVMSAFFGKSELVVNHIDGNKTHNCISNLEYVTHKQNNSHAIELGLINNSGVKNGMAKVTPIEVRKIRKEYSDGGITQKELGLKYGLTRGGIKNIVNQKVWKHID